MTRSDRDQHLAIDYNNIRPIEPVLSQFYIQDGTLATIGNFDFGSVMMYKPNYTEIAIDINKPYMYPKENVTENMPKMGQRNGLSNEDIRKIKTAYCGVCEDKLTTCDRIAN